VWRHRWSRSDVREIILFLSRRSVDSEPLRGGSQNWASPSGERRRALCSQPSAGLFGNFHRLSDSVRKTLASVARYRPVGTPPVSHRQETDGTVCHAPIRADGSCPSGGPSGSAFHEQTQEHWGSPLSLLKGVPLEGVTSYMVVFTDASLAGWGGSASPMGRVDSPDCRSHKCVGALHSAEGVVTLLSPGARPPHSDHNNQCVGGDICKQTGGVVPLSVLH